MSKKVLVLCLTASSLIGAFVSVSTGITPFGMAVGSVLSAFSIYLFRIYHKIKELPKLISRSEE